MNRSWFLREPERKYRGEQRARKYTQTVGCVFGHVRPRKKEQEKEKEEEENDRKIGGTSSRRERGDKAEEAKDRSPREVLVNVFVALDLGCAASTQFRSD